MGSQHSLDVSCGDAIVIVTHAATLRVDCHKLDGDWSLLLQYRAGTPPANHKDTLRWPPLEGQSRQSSTSMSMGTLPGRPGQISVRSTPELTTVQPTEYRGTEQTGRYPNGWEPAMGAFGQLVPCGLFSLREAAKFLHISERTLYKLTKSGEIQAVRFGRAVRYDPDTIKQWIRRRSEKTDQ
jgi:excisionase family DNA binding protein